MIEQEILSAIQDVNDEMVDTENIVSKSITDYFVKQQYVIENKLTDVNETDIVMESTTYNDKSIISKILDAIKTFFSMIINSIKNIINKIKHKGSKDYITFDMAMLKILSHSISNKPDDINSWSIPKVNSKFTDMKNKTITESYEEDYFDDNSEIYQEAFDTSHEAKKEILIPSADGKVIKVETKSKDIIAILNDDNKSITFKSIGYGKFSKVKSTDKNFPTAGTNITETKNPYFGSCTTSLYLISHPDVTQKLVKLTNDIKDIIKNNNANIVTIARFNKECPKLIDEIKSKSASMHINEITISMKDLSNFIKDLDKSVYNIDTFADTKNKVYNFSKTTISNMNKLSDFLLRLQVSLNMLSSSLDTNFIVDYKFFGCIKSVKLLDKFVAYCIKNGLPPKYIAYNTWLVANECIRGKGDKYKPIWGQTRFIFFPPGGKVVYKIAMSGIGITSNKAEERTSKIFVDMGRVDLIAPIVKTWENNTIVAMEAIKSKGKPSLVECAAYTKRCNEVIKDYEKTHNVKLNIKISDQHADNVKYDINNKCYRSIDYGIVSRSV